ncbi:hypothetical protein Tco_1190266 [Tanacetum coccineum]
MSKALKNKKRGKIVMPFLKPNTANKVKVVYADYPNTKSIMENLLCMDELESAFCGKVEESFDIKKYAEKMKEDDAKRIILNKGDTCSGELLEPQKNSYKIIPPCSEQNTTIRSISNTVEKSADTNCVTKVAGEKKLPEDQKIIAS